MAWCPDIRPCHNLLLSSQLRCALHALIQTRWGGTDVANGASVRDVQAIVGHSDPGLTMRIHAQTTDPGRRAAVDALRCSVDFGQGRKECGAGGST